MTGARAIALTLVAVGAWACEQLGWRAPMRALDRWLHEAEPVRRGGR